MTFPRRFSAVLLLIAAVLSVFFFAPAVRAVEEWEAFYEALMNRGYSDVAVSYLESFRGNPAAPASLKENLDRLLGTASLEQIKSAVNKTERRVYSDRAKEYLSRYLKEHPSGDQTYSAYGALADLYTEQGNSENVRLEKGVSEAERQVIQKTVRDCYTKALEYSHTAVAQAKEAAQRMKDNAERSQSEEAKLLYAEYLSLRIKEAELAMKLALTRPKDSEERRNELETSRKAFTELYEKYSRYPGGFKALLLEAKASRELGDEKAVSESLDELIELPMNSALYSIKTETLLLFGQTALEKGDPVNLFRLIDAFYEWKYANDLPQVFYITAEGLQIHLLAGQAVLKLNELKEADKTAFKEAAAAAYNEKKSTSLKLLEHPEKKVYEWFDFVYRQKSPFSLEAEKLLANPIFGDKMTNADAQEPADFKAAVERLNRAWTVFTKANTDAVNALTPDTAQKAAEAKKAAALEADKAFRFAFHLAGRYSAEPGQLDKLRLQRAVLNFQNERWNDAEILADFLLYRRAGSPIAANAAEISLLAAKSAYRQALKDGEDDAVLAPLKDAIQARADYILQKWGDSLTGDTLLPAVREALTVQMDIAAVSGNLDRAKELLRAIPENSSAYADASLQFGQSLWANYVELLSRKKEAPDSISDDLINTILSDAESALAAGLEQKLIQTNGGRGDDLPTVNAALSLAQIELLLAKPNDAYKWLSHPNIGPLTLAERRFEPVQEELREENTADGDSGNNADPEESSADAPVEKSADSLTLPPSPLSDPFQLSALTLALRVLVAQNDFDHAEKVMSALERFVSAGGGSEERLTLVYLQLGKQLQDQIQTLKQKGDTAGLSDVTRGFEGFLDRIAEREAGNTYITLRWAADTYYNFGEGLKPDSGTDPETDSEKENAEKAAGYFKKAGRTYQTILKRIKTEPEWPAAENAATATSIRLSDSLRQLGFYGKSLKVLLPIIETNESNLEIQISAASILQEWGKKNRAVYVKAIQGAVPKKGGRNAVWGWNRIIALLARNIDKSSLYKEKFYGAIISKMECRLAWTAGISDQTERVKQANAGEAELLKLHRLHPDLGGPVTLKKMESFLKSFREIAGADSGAGFPDPNAESEVKEESAK